MLSAVGGLASGLIVDWRENRCEDGDAVKTQLPLREVHDKLSEYERERGAAASKVLKKHVHLEKRPHL